jgi:hypothetical protein
MPKFGRGRGSAATGTGSGKLLFSFGILRYPLFEPVGQGTDVALLEEERGAPVASLIEISRVLEETARLVREHAELLVVRERPEEVDPRWVRGMLDLRALRRDFLGFEASDAALALLLAAYAAHLEGGGFPASRLAAAVDLPPSTAGHIIRRLLVEGAFIRMRPDGQKRPSTLWLSELTAMRLRAYLGTAASLGAMVV